MHIDKRTSLQERLDELQKINPDNLKCSGCRFYPGWVHKKCNSINPLYFCTKHTSLKNNQ